MKIERKKGLKIIRVHHNKTLFWTIIILFLILIAVIALLVKSGNENSDNRKDNASGIANPASVYCIENGGNLTIRTDSTGGQYGVCIFEDRSECEEWKYYNGECTKSSLNNECITNVDCVPASCCHPTSCVRKEDSPVCSGMFCTMDCKPGTLDCGQGSCVCANNKCSAVIE